MKKAISILIRIFISFGAIGLILYFMRDKLDEAYNIIVSEVRWEWFYVALGVYIISHACLSARFIQSLKGQKIHLNFLQGFYLNFLGLFFNLFLPSAVGGDIVKGYYAYKYSGKKVGATTGVVQDRLIGFVGMILMAMIAMLFMGAELKDPRMTRVVYAFLGLVFVAVLFFANRGFASKFKWAMVFIPGQKLKAFAKELYEAIYDYRNYPRILILCLIFSTLGQLAFIITHYFLGLSLSVETNIVVYALFVPLVCIVSMAPSLGGLGVREAGMVIFFQRIMPSEKALALSILLNILIYGFSLTGGIIYAIKGGLKEKPMDEMADAGAETSAQ